MSAARPNYLKVCLAAFGEVSQAKYGTPFDLAAIERKVAALRSKKTLTYHDLQYFESREHWWFQKFWVFPPEHHVGPALAQKPFDFWNVRKNERSTIPELLDIFKSIELVSIILRFIKPEDYGIISPPWSGCSTCGVEAMPSRPTGITSAISADHRCLRLQAHRRCRHGTVGPTRAVLR
jgi:hypothetical protein